MAEDIEVWQNVSLGPKWYISFDAQGRQSTKTVKGGKTFTVSVLERRMNQEAANPAQCLFRNGTFVLRSGSQMTNVEEFESAEALTDAQIEIIVRDVIQGDADPADFIGGLTSQVTLQRILEAFVLDGGAKATVIDAVKARITEIGGRRVNERVAVTVPETGDEFSRFKPVTPH